MSNCRGRSASGVIPPGLRWDLVYVGKDLEYLNLGPGRRFPLATRITGMLYWRVWWTAALAAEQVAPERYGALKTALALRDEQLAQLETPLVLRCEWSFHRDEADSVPRDSTGSPNGEPYWNRQLAKLDALQATLANDRTVQAVSFPLSSGCSKSDSGRVNPLALA